MQSVSACMWALAACAHTAAKTLPAGREAFQSSALRPHGCSECPSLFGGCAKSLASIMVAPGTETIPLASFLISSFGTRVCVPKLPAWRPVGTLGCGGNSRSAKSSWYSSSMKHDTLKVYLPLSLQAQSRTSESTPYVDVQLSTSALL